jgi:hypothetical protein
MCEPGVPQHTNVRVSLREVCPKVTVLGCHTSNTNDDNLQPDTQLVLLLLRITEQLYTLQQLHPAPTLPATLLLAFSKTFNIRFINVIKNLIISDFSINRKPLSF